MKSGLAKVSLCLMAFFSITGARADADGSKVCGSAWEEQRTLFKSWVATKVRSEITNILTDLYKRSGFKVEPGEISIPAQFAEQGAVTSLRIGRIAVSTAQRHDEFFLGNDLISFMTLTHSYPINNPIGETTHFGCGLFVDGWTNVSWSWNSQLINAKTQNQIANVNVDVHVPPVRQVPVQFERLELERKTVSN